MYVSTQTIAADESGHLQILCRRDRDVTANVNVVTEDGEVFLQIGGLDPGELIQIDIPESPAEE